MEGLFAEQVQGRGFEGKDFETYWKPFAENGSATDTLSAGLTDTASIERPDKIRPVDTTVPYSVTLTIELPPYAVSVIEIVANEIRK